MGKKDSKRDAPKAEENVERPGREELCRWPGDAEQRVDVGQPDDGGGGASSSTFSSSPESAMLILCIE